MILDILLGFITVLRAATMMDEAGTIELTDRSNTNIKMYVQNDILYRKTADDQLEPVKGKDDENFTVIDLDEKGGIYASCQSLFIKKEGNLIRLKDIKQLGDNAFEMYPNVYIYKTGEVGLLIHKGSDGYIKAVIEIDKIEISCKALCLYKDLVLMNFLCGIMQVASHYTELNIDSDGTLKIMPRNICRLDADIEGKNATVVPDMRIKDLPIVRVIERAPEDEIFKIGDKHCIFYNNDILFDSETRNPVMYREDMQKLGDNHVLFEKYIFRIVDKGLLLLEHNVTPFMESIIDPNSLGEDITDSIKFLRDYDDLIVLGKAENRLKILNESEFKSYRIEKMDEGVFMIGSKRLLFCNKSASNLEEICLKDRKIKIIDKSIGYLTKLQYLDLGHNQLTSLPAGIGKCINLQGLYLDKNQLTTLPTAIGNLTKLQYLDLFNNQLTALPTNIGNLTELRHLYLRNNNLTSLPADIGNLTNLTVLLVSNNQLTSLPANLGNLINLKYFDLDGNELTELPADICNLTKLQRLDLRNNKLTELPDELGNLKENLRYLELINNPLKKGEVEKIKIMLPRTEVD